MRKYELIEILIVNFLILPSLCQIISFPDDDEIIQIPGGETDTDDPLIYTLNEVNPLYTYTKNIEVDYLWMDTGFEYGIWTRYSPISAVTSIGVISPENSNCSLIHYVSGELEQLIYYMCLDYKEMEIVHNVEFISYNDQQYKQVLKFNSNIKYEGTWIYYHLACLPYQNYYYITMLNSDYSQISQIQYNDQFPFQTGALNYNFGNSIQIQNTRFEIPLLSSFRGNIVLYLIQTYQSQSQLHLSIEEIQQFWESKRELMQVYCDDYLQPYTLTTKLINSQIIIPEYPITVNTFQVMGWFKVLGDISFGEQYELLQISPNLELVGYNDLLEVTQIKLFYQFSQDYTPQIFIQTYSYTLPLININLNEFQLQDIIDVQGSFLEWHYISIFYQASQLLIQYYSGSNQINIQKTLNVNYFTNYDIQLKIGSFLDGQNANLEIDRLAIEQCQTQEPYPVCHETCLTCSGPTRNDCYSCHPDQLRVFVQDIHQCACQFGTWEYQYECQPLSKFNYEIIHLDEESETVELVLCPIGYIKYNGECFKCPEVMSIYVRSCYNCQFEKPDLVWWIESPTCDQQLQSNSKGDSFSLTLTVGLTWNTYVLWFGEFVLCEYCQNIYFTSTFQTDEISEYYHLEQKVYIICYVEYIQFNGKCIQPVINSVETFYKPCKAYCDFCPDGICYSCVDKINYYISLFQPSTCIPCTIKNCKYCFDYSLQDYQTNSYFKMNSEISYDDLVTGCAQCYQGYSYNFQTRECEFTQPTYPCIQQIISPTNEITCILSQELGQTKTLFECQNYINHCKQCISYNNFFTCIICDDGYLVNSKYNKCEQCKQDGVYKCINQISSYKSPNIEFVPEIQLMVYYMTENLVSLEQYYPSEYPYECKEGYVRNGEQCSAGCSDQCEECGLKDLVVECKRCKPSQYGHQIKGYNDPIHFQSEGCEDCLYYCLYCQPYSGLYQKLNPEYVYTPFQEAKCAISEGGQPIDPIYGRVKFGKKTISLDKQYLASNNYVDSFIHATGAIINTDYSNYNILDSLAVDHMINHYIIIEDLVDDYWQYELSICGNFKSGVLTLKNQSLIFEGLQQYIISPFFNSISDSFCNIIEYYNLIFPLSPATEFINHRYSAQELIVKFQSIIFQSDNTERHFAISFAQLKLLNFTDITFKNYKIQESTIIQQNYSSNLISESRLHFTEIKLLNMNLIKSTFISINRNANTTYFYLNKMHIKDSIFKDVIFFNFIDETISFQVNIQNLDIEDCDFSNVIFLKLSKTSQLKIRNLFIKNVVLNNSTLISLANSMELSQISIINSNFIDSTFITISSIYPLNSLLFYLDFLLLDTVLMQDSKIIEIDFKDNHNISIVLKNVAHNNMLDTSQFNTQYYQFYRPPDSGNSIYTAYIQLDNFSFNSNQTNVVSKLSYWTDCFAENGLSSLIYISKFNYVSISNFLVASQIFVDQIAIDINIDQSTGLDNITLTNLTFQQNLLINKQGGQKLYFIQVYIQKSMPLFISNLKFFQNVAHYYLKDISNLDSSFVSLNSYQGNIQMEYVSIVDNYISNKSSSFFSIDCQQLIMNSLTMLNNNLKIVDFFIQNPVVDLSQEILDLFVRQQFSVITKAYFGIISASTFILNNSNFENGYSFQNNLFKMTGKDDCNLTMNNITISNHSSFIKGKNMLTSSTKNLQLIAGSIFVDSSASNLYLTLTNIKLKGIYNKLQSAFLYINPSQTINIVKIYNVFAENIFSLRNGLFFMDLDQSYSQTNLLLIENLEISNSQAEFEQYLSSLKLIEVADLTQIDSQNGFIFISNSLVSVKKLHFSGYFISNILEITNSKSIQLNRLEMHNIVTLSSILVIQQSNVTITHSRIQNIQLYDASQLTHNDELSYNGSQFDLSSYKDCKLIQRQDPLLLYNKLVQEISHELIISLIYKQIDSLINIELSQNNLQIYDAKYSQINSTNSIYGLIKISVAEDSKINLNLVEFVQGYYNTTGHLYIQGDCNKGILIRNSHFSKSECTQGCAVNQDCGSLQIINTVFEKNKALLSGGAVKYDAKSLIIKRSAFHDNSALLGSALDIINMRLDDYSQVNLYNNSNVQISEIPLSLFGQFNGQRLKSVTQLKENIQVTSPTYSEVQQRLLTETNYNQYKEYLKLPSNIPLNQYKIYDEITQEYSAQTFSLQFVPLNKLEEIQKNLTASQCTTYSHILDKQTNSLLTGSSIEIIKFDNSSNSYQISSVTFDPYSPLEQVLQIKIECQMIENYVYQFNVRTYFCQMGEYYSKEGCYPCDYEKGYYSVKANATKCSQIDVNKIEENTENLLKLKPGYWRTYITSEQIEQCRYDYCNGGWEVGTKSCQIGYVGALCEECDTYNQYTKASDSQCLPCKDSWQTIISLILMSLWTLFSIKLTVKSIQEANEQYKSLMRSSKFYGIFHKYNQDVAGCLIKMLTNQVLLISAVYSFQQGLSVDFTWLGAISSPSLTNAFNFDCWLSLQNHIDILYLRLFLILTLPFLYISVFIWLYLLYVISKAKKYDSSTLYIAIIYIFIVTQPDIIKYCGSLLASRTISGVQWIQANLSYQYNTEDHQKWILYCVIPILLLWCVLFPVYFGTTIFVNRKRLGFTAVRRKFSYLYTEYNLKCYYWEIVKIIQRELQVLVLTVFKEEIEIYVCLLFLIQFVYLRIITQIHPYNMNRLNHLEINSVQKCILILIIGLITFITVKQEMNSFSIISQILLIIITLLHLMPFIYDLLLVYLQRYQDKLQELVKSKPWIARFLPKYFENLKRKEVVRKKYQQIKVHLMNRVSSLKKFHELQIESIKKL